MDKVYVVSFGKVKTAPVTKRSKLAVRSIKDFVAKQVEGSEVKLDKELNEKIWARGMKKIPTKLKIKTSTADDGSVLVSLAE